MKLQIWGSLFQQTNYTDTYSRILYYCKHEVFMMTMCKEVAIKIVIALKIVDGSQKKFTVISV